MKRTITLIILILFAGCNNRPAEMPDTFPCKITVVNDGVPLAGCNVGLYSVTGNGSLSIMATADTSGVAEICTRFANYTAKGAPAGTYKVTVEKHASLPPDGVDVTKLSEDEKSDYLVKRMAEAEKQRVVPVALTSSTTTPFEIQLAPGGTSQWTFDVKEHAK
jgi:hypothetical protein